jgi:hypothetical protein
VCATDARRPRRVSSGGRRQGARSLGMSLVGPRAGDSRSHAAGPALAGPVPAAWASLAPTRWVPHVPYPSCPQLDRMRAPSGVSVGLHSPLRPPTRERQSMAPRAPRADVRATSPPQSVSCSAQGDQTGAAVTRQAPGVRPGSSGCGWRPQVCSCWSAPVCKVCNVCQVVPRGGGYNPAVWRLPRASVPPWVHSRASSWVWGTPWGA